eukprot:415194-Lingulodinium_polyedra.AAC.1
MGSLQGALLWALQQVLLRARQSKLGAIAQPVHIAARRTASLDQNALHARARSTIEPVGQSACAINPN